MLIAGTSHRWLVGENTPQGLGLSIQSGTGGSLLGGDFFLYLEQSRQSFPKPPFLLLLQAQLVSNLAYMVIST